MQPQAPITTNDIDSTRTVRIKAESGWHHSRGDAEDECDRKLDALEDRAISDARRDGGRYSTGHLGPYQVTHDSGRDLFRCSRQKTLYFDYSNNLVENNVTEEMSWEEYQSLAAVENFEDVDGSGIDVTNELRSLLQSRVPPFQMHTFVRFVPGPRGPTGIPLRIPVVKTVKLPLSKIQFRELKILSSDLKLDADAVPVGLPLSEQNFVYPYRNCSPVAQRFERHIEYEVTRGTTITFQKTITSEVKIEGRLTFTSGEVSGSASQNVQISETKEIRNERRETISQTYPFEIAPQTITEAKLTIRQFEARRGFNGIVTVDGTAVLIYGKGEIKKKVVLSTILNESQRSINVSGFYSNLDYEVIPISISTENCPN